MVIISPKKKPTKTINQTFFVLTRLPPILSPISLIDISAPRLKKIMPIITKQAPKRKLLKTPIDIGTIVNPKNKTRNTIGKTAFNASSDFPPIFFNNVSF